MNDKLLIQNASARVILSAALMCLLLTGCTITRMTTRYNPLHPANAQRINYRVVANDSDGISRVELHIFEMELYVGANNMQSARQRPGGQWGLADSRNFAGNPTSIDETFNLPGFPASSFIRFTFVVRDSGGREKSETWNFAAGTWPFGNSPIPLWGNGAPAQRIDVCFVADRTDFTNARDMLDELEPLIFDGYHRNNGVRVGRKFWQFYYSPDRGFISDFDSPPLNMDIPSSVSSSTIIDHAAVIHTTVKRDWASGGNFGTEPTNIGTAVHESGHAAFSLKDEYSGGGHGTSALPHHNNYNSRASAETYNSSNGWPISDVENIEGSWWRPEPASLNCIMIDDGDASMPDFQRTCLGRIYWKYDQLEP